MNWLDTVAAAEPGWTLFVIMVVLIGIIRLIFRSWNRLMRHLNIRKHGWPLPHCDADGDFKEGSETSG